MVVGGDAPQRSVAADPIQSLTTYPGFEATPTFSPDGRQVAFSWDGDQRDNDDIYVIFVGSDLPHRLTTNPARDVSPAWKPDGSLIAFARLDDAHVGVYVASPLGGAEQRIATFPPTRISTSVRGTAEPSLSWSPDGRWLAVSHIAGDNPSSLHVISQDGSENRQVLAADQEHNYTAVAFSPEGDALAFVDSGHLGVVEIDPAEPSRQRRPPRRLSAYQGSSAAWHGRSTVANCSTGGRPTPPLRRPISGASPWTDPRNRSGSSGGRRELSRHVRVRSSRLQPP